MATTDVEKLLVRVEANLKQYESAFAKANGFTAREMRKIERQAEAHVKRVERTMQGVFSGLKGIGAGIVGGLGLEAVSRAVVDVVRDVANLADEAKRAGVSFEDLQLIADVAADAGVETDQVVDLFQKLNKQIGDAITKGNELGEILRLNGVPLKDQNGQVRSTLTMFYEVVDLISRTKSQQEAAAVGAAAFTKSAADALPFLQQGSAAIKEGAQAARDAGRYMSNEVGQTADDIDDRWAQMWRGFEKGGKTAIVEIVRFMQATDPYILGQKLREKLVESFTAGAGDGNDLFARQEDLQRKIKLATEDTFGGAPQAMLDAWKQELAGVNAQLEISAAFLDAIQRKQLPGISRNPYEVQKWRGTVLPTPKPPKPPKPDAPRDPEMRQQDEFSRAVETISERTAALRTEADAMGLATEAAERLRAERELLNAAEAAGIKLTPEIGRLIGELAGEYGQAAQAAETLADYQEDLNDIGATVKDVFLDISEGVSVVDALTGAFERLRQKLLDAALDKLIGKAMDGLGGSGGIGLSGLYAGGGVMSSRGDVPLKRYAGGGVANSPQLAMFGEGSRPEAFVPLPDGRSIPVRLQMPDLAGARGQRGGYGNVTIHNYGGQVEQRQTNGSNGMRELEIWFDARLDRKAADPYSGLSTALSARGAKNPIKRR